MPATLIFSLTTQALASGADGWFSGLNESRADKGNDKPQVSVELIAKNDALTPQAVNDLAVVINQKDGWHTYWKMPGDAGLKSKFYFNVPKNYDVTIPSFPLPERIVTGDIVSFGYNGESVFPFKLEVPRFVRFGDKVTITVRVEYLACKNICVPGEATSSIRLPIQVVAKEGKNASRIEEAKKLIPEVIQQTSVTASYEENRIKITVPQKAGVATQNLDFYPLDEYTIKLNQAPLFRLSKTENREIYLLSTDSFAKNPTSHINGVLVADKGPAFGGWAVETSIPLIAGNVPQFNTLTQTHPTSDEASVLAQGKVEVETQTTSSIGTIGAILFAFLGGLILNLMPCVFPVLSLKLLQLIKGSSESRTTLAKHGIIFGAGIVVTMLVLSGILIALRSSGAMLGWGFQLQNPIVVGALLILFVGITLNLLGVFEVNVGGSVADKFDTHKNDRSEYLNSFLTGTLAVIVASPCTAPFMGAALGYALTQSALEALLIFAFLGIGMTLPWTLLCLFPSWAKKLPKPGPWMEKFKKIMAIPMALAVIWLGWVLSKQINFYGQLIVLCGAAAAAVAYWLIGREQWGKGKNRPLLAFLSIVAIASIIVSSTSTFEVKAEITESQKASGWEKWSQSAVEKAVTSGKPVFVDFTAAWCVTCQANKLTAIHNSSVEAKMDKLGYVKLIADWTNKDPEISKVLTQYGRSGVPLYLIYRPNGKVDVLPELLTPDTLLNAL